jgi:hypothetical protein
MCCVAYVFEPIRPIKRMNQSTHRSKISKWFSLSDVREVNIEYTIRVWNDLCLPSTKLTAASEVPSRLRANKTSQHVGVRTGGFTRFWWVGLWSRLVRARATESRRGRCVDAGLDFSELTLSSSPQSLSLSLSLVPDNFRATTMLIDAGRRRISSAANVETSGEWRCRRTTEQKQQTLHYIGTSIPAEYTVK